MSKVSGSRQSTIHSTPTTGESPSSQVQSEVGQVAGESLEQETAVLQSSYQGNGGVSLQETASPDAQFAVSGLRAGQGSSVLNLQIAEGTQGVEMATTGAVSETNVSALQDVAAVQRAKAAQELNNVPTVAELEGLKSGDLKASDVAASLKTALLSNNPQVVQKAARTLQVAESYSRKAEQDKVNYAGTGFQAFHFPKLELKLNSDETHQLMRRVVQHGNSETVDVMFLAEKQGLLRTEPAGIFHSHQGMKKLYSGQSALLQGSDGRESPRGADTFREEWETQVKPGLTNIREAIAGTAKAKGPGCPYAQGNHAKGIAFDNAEMKLDPQAPDWAKDMFGSSLKGGMIRVSGSQTDPDQPDQESHMPGIRIAFPVNGALDGSATQTIDITANTGSTTHAQTGAEHTQFTKDISVPKDGFLGSIRGSKPVRAVKHALGGLFAPGSLLEKPGNVVDRIKAMRNAVEVTDMAMGQKFHEHTFHGRHAFFVGGRYVQVRFKVIEPKDFPDPNQSNAPHARLDAVEETVGKNGMKLAMYITELPNGNPDRVEEEGWEGLPEVRLATIEVPAQEVDNHSKASQWFTNIPHVPGGPDKVFTAAGLGRHRVPIYMESGKFRNEHNRMLATRN